jgi:hypothetical protein
MDKLSTYVGDSGINNLETLIFGITFLYSNS